MNVASPDQTKSLRNPALLKRLLIYTGISVVLLLVTSVVGNRFEKIHSVFTISNYLGVVAENLHNTGRMVLIRTGVPYIGTVPFYAARMPFPIVFLLALYEIFGSHFFLVRIAKTFLLFLPILFIVWMALAACTPRKINWALGLLLVPFLTTGFILLATSLQLEEAYCYSFLACALALFYYFHSKLIPNWLAVMLFALCVDLSYLSKSSMRFVCVVLVAAMFLQLRSATLRTMVVILTLIAPLGWGFYTYQMTGRFTLGSSLDGFNLHLGNFPDFLSIYPPNDNGHIDKYHPLIIPKTALFRTEWEDNDYHIHLGVEYMRDTQAVITGALRKAYYYFLSLRSFGTGHDSDLFTRLDIINMVLMRLLMLGAMAYSIWNIIKRRCILPSIAYLLFVAGTALPFIVGYAYTRHIFILIFPSALTLAYFLTAENQPCSTPMQKDNLP
jgi:hypothetical protein